MKPFLLPFLLVVTLTPGLLSWQECSRAGWLPGQVESQIRLVSPQLTPQLASACEFDRVGTAVAQGYRPRLASAPIPAGLKTAEQQALEALAQREADLTPLFPVDYSRGTEVRGQGMTITLKPTGSAPAQAQVEQGKLVYHNAYRSTDSLQVVNAGRSEEFLLLRDADAPQRFEYELSGMQGVKDVTLQKDGAIHFKNAQGQELQIEAPWLVESSPVAAAVPSSLSGLPIFD